MKKLAKKPRNERLVRRAKARFASERQSAARTEAIASARQYVLSVLAALNDQDRDPEARTQAQRRRGLLPIPGYRPPPGFAAEAAAGNKEGAAVAAKLLGEWDAAFVQKMIGEVRVVGAEYRLRSDGGVELEPKLLSGSPAALVALSLAQARDLLRSVDGGVNPFRRRIKRCVNPTCGKWFFDVERGTRKWCCVACGNAHRQLKFVSPRKYLERLKSGEYARRRCPCSRPNCEG